MQEALFIGFPLNLLWGFLLYYLLLKIQNNSIKKIIFWSTGAITLAAGNILPAEIAMIYWSPSGFAVIILSSLCVYFFTALNQQLVHDDPGILPARQILRADITRQGKDKQQVYIEIVQKMSTRAVLLDTQYTALNSLAMFISFAVVAVVSGLIFMLAFIQNDLFTAWFEEIYTKLPFDHTNHSKEDTLKYIIHYFPVYAFIQSSLVFLLIASFLRNYFTSSQQKKAFFGTLTFFKLPDIFIWIFIGSSILVAVSHRVLNNPELQFISINLFFIIAYLYVLQSIGLIQLYGMIRVLPNTGVLILMVLLSMIFPSVTVYILVALLLLGLLEFWFNFRKKALHPNLLSNSDF